jgi:hypothetical protein
MYGYHSTGESFERFEYANYEKRFFAKSKGVWTLTDLPRSSHIATASAVVINGFVVGANISDGGFGYRNAPNVLISGGGGTGATATATILGTVVTSIKIANPGSGYTNTPTISIDSPPMRPRAATATATLVNGFVVGFDINDGGHAYTEVPLVVLRGGGGSGATAVAVLSNGVVTELEVTNPGSDYTSAPEVMIASSLKSIQVPSRVSRIAVDLRLILGQRYLLESSKDLIQWTKIEEEFVAQTETMTEEFDVSERGQFFRISQVR